MQSSYVQSANAHPLIGQLRPIFVELKNSTSHTLPSIILKLEYVIDEEKDALFHRNSTRVLDTNARVFPDWLNGQLRELFGSPATELAGVRVLRALLRVEYVELNEMTKLFSELLVTCVLNTTDFNTGIEASEVWGTLLNNGSSVVETIVDNSLRFSLELLVRGQDFREEIRSWADRHTHNVSALATIQEDLASLSQNGVAGSAYPQATKLSGCIFLRQLMKHTPSSLISHIDQIMLCLAHTVFDAGEKVRVVAAEALRYTLRAEHSQYSAERSRIWNSQLLNSPTALKLSTISADQTYLLHGLLLTLTAVLSTVVERRPELSKAEKLPEELGEANDRAVRVLWGVVNHSIKASAYDGSVHNTGMSLLPLLAQYDCEYFLQISFQPLLKAAAHVFECIDSAEEDERPLFFHTLAKTFAVLPQLVAEYSDFMIRHIEASLLPRGNRGRCLAAVTCFATLAKVEPKAVRPFLRHIMGPLFAGSITESFARDVATICATFPELRSTCLSKVLNATKEQLQLIRHQPQISRTAADGPHTFVLDNLKALCILDFTGYSTLQFLCDVVVRYVSDPHEEVRRGSIDLCFKLALSGCSQSPCERTDAGVVIHRGREHMRLINTVLRKLVNAAVADTESDIRLYTLERLGTEFDHTLALQEICTSLFPTLHDHHQNRLAAVRLLGRLSIRNPSCIYPALRRVMVQCIADIQLFEVSKKQEQAAMVLSAMVESAPHMAQPYVTSLLRDTVDRLISGSHPVPVQTALLSLVGKLARYAEGPEDTAVAATVRPCVVQHILDSSNIQKKLEAIRALCDIIRTTKDINVYETNPELLRVLISALHGSFKETWPVRLDVLKLMGIIGALDPVSAKDINRRLRDRNLNADGSSPASWTQQLSSSRGDEAVARDVVKNSVDILSLPSLSDDQCSCAVRVIANTLSLKEVSEGCLSDKYRDIITAMLTQIRGRPKIRVELVGVLTHIIYLLGQHVRRYLDEVITLCTDLLPTADAGTLMEVLYLLKELRLSLRDEFRPCLARLLPPIIQAAQVDVAQASEPAFAFMVEMTHLLDDYLHLVLPCVCDVAANSGLPMPCRMAAMDALGNFAKHLPHLVFHAARCVHCVSRVLAELEPHAYEMNTSDLPDSAHGELMALTLVAAANLARNLGTDFEKYIPMLAPLLELYGKDGEEVKSFIQVSVRSRGRVLAPDHNPRRSEEDVARYRVKSEELTQRHKAAVGDDYAQLWRFLADRSRETEGEWNAWLRQLPLEFLRASSSNAHAFAYALAQRYEPFARHMLHSAFVVCYREMDAETQEKLRASLGYFFLHSKSVPPEVQQELLNLSEFMERLEMRFNPKPGCHVSYSGLLFDLRTLMDSSERCHLFAKALHYVEIQFHEATYEYELSLMRGVPEPLSAEEWEKLLELCEKSIYLCNLLGLRESAEGMLKYIQMNFSFLTGKPASELPRMMDAQLFEKLQWWSQSLLAYEEGLKEEPNKFSNMVGLMRSLDNLGDYNRLLESWRLFSPRISRKEASEIAPYGAHAAWLLRCWDDMEKITAHMTDDGYVGTTAVFHRAVLATHKQRFHEAVPLIREVRRRLDSTLSSLVAESYDRAYGLFVGVQQLSELEEFAFVAENPKDLHHWQSLWEKRLGAMAYEGWPGTLSNHTLVIAPVQELDMWLRFVALSRVHGREQTSRDILRELLGSESVAKAINQPDLPQPMVALAAFQHLYDTQEREEAVGLLDQYLTRTEQSDLSEVNPGSLAACHAKLASWLFTLKLKTSRHIIVDTQSRKISRHLEEATRLDGSNGAIWHTWARFNHSLATKTSRHSSSKSHGGGAGVGTGSLQEQKGGDEGMTHIIAAMEGYIRSVCLSSELEDVLGFLSIWFAHASAPAVRSNQNLLAQVLQVSPTVWLKVIPQIIARLHSRDAVVAESVFNILAVVAKAHPQALLYNLNVATNATLQGAKEQNKAAKGLLNRIVGLHRNGDVMVRDAALVCQELVRCAVLWTEIWFDELERVWFQWGRDQNAQNVLATLQPLLDRMENPETLAESHFTAEFSDQLYSARGCVEKAATTGNNVYMDEAWNRFKSALKRMDEQISGMSSLALQLVSPRLMQDAKNLSLVVPGQYNENGSFPRIASFQSTLKVLNSKQHPRRIYLSGTDGVSYKFLLKGHEDLRLDERVMQLLAFVNTLLDKHAAIKRRDCMIQVFSVTPLSENAGLVGWVDHCDTIHQLIKEYRVHSKYLSIELNLMRSFGVDLDRLQVIQHVEPFEYALEQTEGTDLANSMWMKAPSAETWLDRRTTYVCSLASMSMVGHVLGLGDRHPSNLMVHSFGGRVVHIDFGDCFEVAQTRSAFPEMVPFRLTRMLVKAMEMGGVEGLFRHGCITVMNVLREEGSSIVALLEAFVYDPLVSWWRDDAEESGAAAPSSTAGSVSAASVDSGAAPRTGQSKPSVHFSREIPYASMGESFSRSRRAFADQTPRAYSFQRRGVSVRTQAASASVPATESQASKASAASAIQANKAQKVVHRIREKLEGREFDKRQSMLRATSLKAPPREKAIGADLVASDAGATAEEGLSVEAQVSRLIAEATSNEHLSVHFQGWCPFW